MAITFIQPGWQKRVESGEIQIVGYSADGSIIENNDGYTAQYSPKTQWAISTHSASEYGTKLIQNIIGKRFSFPKSLYAVHDTIRFFVANKPTALIVDFFAGSGTTLHAVNLLNAEDGGHRRCIMVTNNEVSAEEAKTLTEKGFKPGDEEWERLGIARYVTWPRTVCAIEGHDVNGQPLKGNYLGSDRPMADGFQANAAFFKLGFLDKTKVSLGMQFKELLSTLWMKAGAIGKCPTVEEGVPDMLILPGTKNTMDDLAWLRASGFAGAILAAAKEGTPILGICGGYQILGRSLHDPEGVEKKGTLPGLGLLPADTVFTADKTRTRRSAVCKAAPFAGAALTGVSLSSSFR